jgi:type IV pilus assembly protein PilE
MTTKTTDHAADHARPGPRRATRGFTLIELMIVLAIISILSAIAYPSYMAYILRSHRTDATRALMQASAKLEQFYSQNQSYNQDASAGTPYNTDNNGLTLLAALNLPIKPTDGSTTEGYYRLSVSALAATSYTLKAIPLGTQQKDTECGTFSLDSLGTRGAKAATTPDTTAATVSQCWER